MKPRSSHGGAFSTSSFQDTLFYNAYYCLFYIRCTFVTTNHNFASLLQQAADVKLLVAICFCEIIRILAPNPDFSDELLRDIFKLFKSMLEELADTSSPYFSRRVKLLETVAKLEFCVLIIHTGEHLILKMFTVFYDVVSKLQVRSTNKDVKLLVAICFCEIIRILAPNPDFRDELLRDIFKLFINTGFEDLILKMFTVFYNVVKSGNSSHTMSCTMALILTEKVSKSLLSFNSDPAESSE
ncbi:hypothetical protein POM88_037700 [Heracleum sosnowskyi]|uniref:Uncharacterized protein n=1 Tax=Heracleum sosnowskyi TaxID=360622 RepID=A0AAD8HSN9_9APIA|nr:hypothetical protein POM88_037700 [Heracleum sosnowskyi]